MLEKDNMSICWVSNFYVVITIFECYAHCDRIRAFHQISGVSK